MSSPADLVAELSLQRDACGLRVTTRAGRPRLELSVGSTTLEIDLGIVADGQDLGDDAAILRAARRTATEDFTLFVGKSVGPRVAHHEELTVDFSTNGAEWSLIARVAADGFAFRYRLPAGARQLGDELTRLEFEPDHRAWVLDYTPWYEAPRFGSSLGALAPGDYGFPMLLEVAPDTYALLTESDIDGRHSGAHAETDGTSVRIRTADGEHAVADGHCTPWRVIIAGDLSTIVTSTLVDELAPPPAGAVHHPRPGRAAWSWWSSQYSGAYQDVQERFCDFAAEQGWEHILIDCGWDAAWVPELVSYASARGLQVHLWSSWSDLDGQSALRSLELWKSWGVAGVKVDFMESESRVRYQWYDAIIAEAARVGLMLNFHGSVIPRGWARTHPHVVSYEAIRGAEWYVFYDEPLTAAHNVIQPFTRNVVGSMDYTPVTFSAPGRETTDGHELALSVVFESGITHFADDPKHYRARPLAARFLAEVPAVWDATVLVDGHPDQRAVIARRSHDRWFIGGISALAEETTVSINLSRFGPSPVTVWTLQDGPNGLEETHGTSDDVSIEATLAPRGGFVAIVAPSSTSLLRATPRRAVEVPKHAESIVVLTGASARISSSARSIRPAPGWTAHAEAPGVWTVAPNYSPSPGEVTVFTLEADGHDGVPAVSHVRVLTPLTEELVLLAGLPFVAASNQIGPVERGLANGGGDPRDGAPLTVRGRTYCDGLGVSQRSEIEFAVSGTLRRLIGAVGIDDETPGASAHAFIDVDGENAAAFDIRGGSAPTSFEIDITGARRLTLRTSPAGDGGEAHVDWLEPQLVP